MTKIKTLDNKTLVIKLKELVAAEKKNVAAQIALLKEIKQRNLTLELGYPSLMAFCEEELGLTKDQAWKRSQAAGAVEKEPELFHMLATGKTNLSALAVVAPKITEQTKGQILEFIPQKSKREVEAFASTLRRDGTRERRPQTVRRSFDLTLKTEDKLKQAARLLRQNNPDITEADVLDAALELLLEKRDPARKAERAMARAEKKAVTSVPKDRKTQSKQTAPGQAERSNRELSRYVPAKIRHRIYAPLTEARCSFVGANGRRCSATHGLHIDHIKPYALGGSHSPENLRLMCPAHNRHIAPARTG